MPVPFASWPNLAFPLTYARAAGNLPRTLGLQPPSHLGCQLEEVVLADGTAAEPALAERFDDAGTLTPRLARSLEEVEYVGEHEADHTPVVSVHL